MTDITPPYSPNTEEALLGAILINPEAIKQIAIEPEDFYIERNRYIWAAVQELTRENKPVDFVTVCTRLQENGKLSDVGGAARITGILAGVPSSLHASAYAENVKALAYRRRVIDTAQRLAQSAYDQEADMSRAVATAMDALSKAQTNDKGAVHIGWFLSSLYDQTEAASKNPKDIYGIPTGFRDWDRITAGLQRGTVVKLSGEPGLGKSLLACEVLRNAAQAGHPGALYELEMGCAQVVRRFASAGAKVPTYTMRSGRMSDEDWNRFTPTIEALSRLPVYMSDSSDLTTAEIRADLHRLIETYGVEMAVIDYEGLIADQGGKDDTERSKIVSSRVHAIAKDLNIALLVIDDMNKTGIQGQGGKAGLSGSARKLHDADEIIIMRKQSEGHAANTIIRCSWEKNREGDPDRFFDLYKLPNFPTFAAVSK